MLRVLDGLAAATSIDRNANAANHFTLVFISDSFVRIRESLNRHLPRCIRLTAGVRLSACGTAIPLSCREGRSTMTWSLEPTPAVKGILPCKERQRPI